VLDAADHGTSGSDPRAPYPRHTEGAPEPDALPRPRRSPCCHRHRFPGPGRVRAHGRPTERVRGHPGYGAEVSLREREGAALAATGLTNRDIAAILHLSARTVEQHVARSLRKTGAGSRRDLAQYLGPSEPAAQG